MVGNFPISRMIEDNPDAWYSTLPAALAAVLSQKTHQGKTYLYAHNGMAMLMPGLVAQRMDDWSPTSGGLGLRKDSEMREMMNHQLLKMAETGILK